MKISLLYDTFDDILAPAFEPLTPNKNNLFDYGGLSVPDKMVSLVVVSSDIKYFYSEYITKKHVT